MSYKESLLAGYARRASALAANVLKSVALDAPSRFALAEALQYRNRDRFKYRAGHANRPTAPRQRNNLRYIDVPGHDEPVRLTRGERKRVLRQMTKQGLASGRVSLSTPAIHANRRSQRDR